jgi:uncharacterized protein with HEPN domain
MSNNILFNLKALLEAIEKIRVYSKDFDDADEFYHDQKSFDASMMQFVVIGEIITRLDDDYKKLHNDIPWQKIKDFRNIVAHDYFGIDADEIWDIINNKLLPLKNDIDRLII